MHTRRVEPISSPAGSDIQVSWKGKHPLAHIDVWNPSCTFACGEKNRPHELFWGEHLEILGHLLSTKRGHFDLIYADPPFDSVADYKKKITPINNKEHHFYQEQYTDHWKEGEYAQFIYSRLLIFRDLLSPTGSLYLHCDWHRAGLIRMLLDEVFGRENFLNEIIWHHDFGGRGTQFLARKHDNIFLYKKGKQWYFDLESLPTLPYQGNLHKYRGSEKKGKKPTAVWHDIPLPASDFVWDIAYENKMSSKNTGYPTQKPEELLKRLISLSCPPQGLILDPFLGSGTTLRAAEALDRCCMGIDANADAIETSKLSLLKQAPKASVSVFSLYTNTAFSSEAAARKYICTLENYVSQNNFFATTEKGEWVLFAPLCRDVTPDDLSKFTSFFLSLFATQEKVHLWGANFDVCHDIIDNWKNKHNIEVHTLPYHPPFAIDWHKTESELVIDTISFPLLRQKLGCTQQEQLDWKQLVQSITLEHIDEVTNSIFIATKHQLVPTRYNITSLKSITVTDILSRSVTLCIDSM